MMLRPALFVLDLGKEQHFDVVELKETIEKGQRFLVSPLMWL